MKIALVHDELVRRGGAEQVLLSFHRAFPDAPIYTLSYNPDSTYQEFKKCNIITSWFGKFIKDDKNLKRFFFPFGVWAMQRLKVQEYEVILQSTTHSSKYVDTDDNALIITYCHTPFRLVWRPNSYEKVAEAGFIKRKMYDTVIRILKKIDRRSSRNTDWFITNAEEVVQRIKLAYRPKNPITVINPPVKCKNFFVADSTEDYYLVVSRFEPYKRVDLVIEAFNNLKDKKLIIVGKGSMEESLKKRAGKNVKFLQALNSGELAEVFAKCKALIFPQLEDYGITPLEANASGRPVIAFGRGGVLDTMIPVENDPKIATAVFFNEQTVDSLTCAINQFESLSFDPGFIRKHAEKYDEAIFIEKIREFVTQKFSEKQQQFSF